MEQPQPKRAKVVESDTPPAFVDSSRSDKYYAPAPEAAISEELTSFIKSAFTKQLSKDVWTNVMDQYPDIKGSSIFVSSKQIVWLFGSLPLTSCVSRSIQGHILGAL